MKKLIILVLTVILLGGSAYAYNDSLALKKSFYDGFLKGMFYSLEQSIASRGIPRAKAARYTAALKKRVNRTQLENATWACVSKYSPQEMETYADKLAEECFHKWADDFYNKNSDLIYLLK